MHTPSIALAEHSLTAPWVQRLLLPASLLAAFGGLFAAAVLSLGHILDVPVPCGSSHGCATVAAHPSSKLFGVPIAFFGVVYFVTQIALISQAHTNGWCRRMSLVLATVGAMLSAALLLYARFVIHATCAWCVVSGVAMGALGAFGWLGKRFPRQSFVSGPRLRLWSGLVSALAVGVQAGRMQRAALAPPIAAETLAKLPAGVLFDSANSLGPANAAVTVVVFADFLCPACRSELGSLVRYQQANPAAVRVVYRHLPLSEIPGHESSQAIAAVSEIAAEQGAFWRFTQAVHSRRVAHNEASVLGIIRELGLDGDLVFRRIRDDADAACVRVARDRALAATLGIQATPTFIVQLAGSPPVAASPKGLARLLNSPRVIMLLEAAQRVAAH